MESSPDLGLEYDIDSKKTETVTGKTIKEATNKLNLILYVAQKIESELLNLEYKAGKDSHRFELVFYRYSKPTRAAYFKAIEKIQAQQEKGHAIH